ncbi:MAG TPA: glycosyltransferase family 2 protein, partial [Parabacteroides goldsteinii]|nr:glycosyltransferase family 2 protein [Parabacteroides goldsteinii]
MLSIICPIYNEEKYIVGCIDSILKQDYPRNDWEVLFVDGMSTDRTREIVQDYCLNYDFIRLIDNPQKIVPHAMNKGISVAKGDVIIRLDAHALYKDDYCSVLTKQLKALGADNVGAVCKTDVQHKTSKTLAIREVLSNKFGVGN